ncbi:MAG: ABC transporter permease [Chitinophagales bacterium]|nr:ABC transporter permease [Chitinophagales bacterium]MDW8420113.1 ABC transporter permease [Chitinophagales bacterium]
MNLAENIRLAFRVISVNKLRTSLTLLIIAFGIAALIGILTSTEGIRIKMLTSFSEMGSNTFGIKNEGVIRRRGGPHRRRDEENPPITLAQAQSFSKTFSYPSVVSISVVASTTATIQFQSKRTNPNVKIFGADENYLKVSGQSVVAGRNFSRTEVMNGSDVILLGKDVVAKIFQPFDTAVGKMVSVGSRKYKVVGLLGTKGASQIATDNQAIIPVLNARYAFPGENPSYIINVMVDDARELDLAIEEATGIMRAIRKLKPGEEDNFSIAKSERLAEQILDQLTYVKVATVVIGVLTLIGAGIGLMNIMLVSVNERTREIGISKALGATRKAIRIQFLTEAIVICQLGGILGIVMGIGIGNLAGYFLGTGFLFPYGWVSGGFVFTFLVGLAAGIYPALKAGDLNPVEALRYE